MTYVEWFWMSWLSVILVPMALMLVLFVGYFILGFGLEVFARISEWFRGDAR